MLYAIRIHGVLRSSRLDEDITDINLNSNSDTIIKNKCCN